MRIACRGEGIIVDLNGVNVVTTDMSRVPALANRPRKGYIGFANWRGEAKGIEFRSVRVRELDHPRGVVAAVASAESTKAAPPADSKVFGKGRYKLFEAPLTWREADARCREMGGRLVVIHAQGKNDFIRDLAKGTNLDGLWLGATDEGHEGDWNWRWTDAPGLSFKNYSRGQPDNAGAGEHFLMMELRTNPGEWADVPDLSSHPRMGFVCEWHESVPPTTPPSPSASPSEDGWVSLFNGKDLTGWRLHQSQNSGWTVEKGILTGRGTASRPITYLYTNRNDLRDFELSAECRINSVGDSGLQIRSSFGPRLARFPTGYEVQIYFGSRKPGTQTGGIFASGRSGEPVAIGPAPTISGTEWFTLNVSAEGSHFVTRLNGNTVADYVDPEPQFTQGCLALQVLHEDTVVEFRSIRIRESKVTSPVQREKATATFKVSPSGLRYRILVAGTGDKPQPQQTVEVHYEGSLEDGTVFDSSYVRNQPSSFPLPKVVRGVAEGLQLIGKGGKIELDVPPDLAYGQKGAPPSIPPNARLRFVFELLDAN